jgi:amino acid transporter
MAIAEALPGAATTDEGLRRGLSRFHALAIVMGAMIGTGIYLRPASIAQLVQSPSRILAVWVVAGLFSFAGALTYAELASRLPRSGGEYAFLHEMLGVSPAFLFGCSHCASTANGRRSSQLAWTAHCRSATVRPEATAQRGEAMRRNAIIATLLATARSSPVQAASTVPNAIAKDIHDGYFRRRAHAAARPRGPHRTGLAGVE